MKTLKKYSEFNPNRYGNPWVCAVDSNAKLDFGRKIGGYTGGYNKGEAGELYISDPVENAIYAYGQKDYRGKNSGYTYVQYVGGEFVWIEKTDLIATIEKNNEQHDLT